MKLDPFLFFVSLFFSLAGLLLEDVTSAGLQWVAILKYIPMLILYIKYFDWSFASFLPLVFAIVLLLLSFGGGHYSMAGILVSVMLPVTLFVYTKLTFTRRQISIMVLMFFAAYFLYVIIGFFTHNNINPNQISFKILILTVILFFGIFAKDGGHRLVIHTYNGRKRILGPPGLSFFLVLSLMLILITECRNSLLVYLILIAAFVVKDRVAKWDKWGWILFGLLVLYVLYPFVYCLLSESLHHTANTEMMGQDVFSGREIIWSYLLMKVTTDPTAFFFGDIDTEWWGKSMHNSALDFLVKYGVPIMVIMELIVLFYFNKICSTIKNKYKPLFLLVIGTMIWGVNESGMFLGFSFYLFLPCCILRSKNKSVIGK